jgi:DNA polymerase-3 subunit chi
MTERVDFYVLTGSTVRQRWVVGCRLAEKAYLRDLSVVVLSDTVEATAVDELLWTFNERSFVPHDLLRGHALPGTAASAAVAPGLKSPTPVAPSPVAPTPEAPTPEAPVRVTPDLDWVPGADLLVNLTDRMPEGLERFARIAEIIDADDTRRRLGRERFRAYRELRLPVETHNLDEAAGN